MIQTYDPETIEGSPLQVSKPKTSAGPEATVVRTDHGKCQTIERLCATADTTKRASAAEEREGATIATLGKHLNSRLKQKNR